MEFEVFIHPKIYNTIPDERRKQLLSAVLELCDPFPDPKGDKKEVKGAEVPTYRLRVGGYRVFYQFDENEKRVYVIEILTAEQAHKKYGRC
jgi:mRNA interferase RelE/StbE